MTLLRPSRVRALAPVLFVTAMLALAACDSGTTYSADPPTIVGGLRPANVYRPSDYDPSRAYPLVLLLHGYGANGFLQDTFFGTSGRVDAHQYLLVVPEGVTDASDKQYWNAGPCCAFAAGAPDDVAYLTGLVDEMERTYHVDRGRVYVLGHSNGGAMAMKLACAASDHFTAIASLAGIAPEHETDCPATTHDVSVLQMHGDADDVVLYAGSTVQMGIPLSPYPSAPEAARRFASRLGCDTTMSTVGPVFDLWDGAAGPETTPTVYATGCHPGTSAELWTIAGAPHVPFFVADGTDRVLDWLFAHHR